MEGDITLVEERRIVAKLSGDCRKRFSDLSLLFRHRMPCRQRCRLDLNGTSGFDHLVY